MFYLRELSHTMSSYFFNIYCGLDTVSHTVNGELVFYQPFVDNHVFFSLVKYDSKLKDTRLMDMTAVDSPGKHLRFFIFSIFFNNYFSSKKKLVNPITNFSRPLPMYSYFASAM